MIETDRVAATVLQAEPSRQVHWPDPPIRFAGRSVVFLAALLLCVYASFPTRNHYWDGISFSLTIEGVGHSSKELDWKKELRHGLTSLYYNPNHLFYNLIGYLIYQPLHTVFPRLRSLDVLRTLSMVLSTATACVFFLMFIRWSRDLRLSIWLTLLMAFSATWWKYSTDANAYVPSTFVLTVAGFLLANSKRKPPAVTVGLLHALSMVLHQISVFFFPAALAAIWNHPSHKSAREKRRAVLAYQVAASVPVVAAYGWVWFAVLDGEWSSRAFMTWLTFNGSDTFSFQSAWWSTIESLRSSLRVFFGGRASLAFEFVERPLLFFLMALMFAALVWLAVSLVERPRIRGRSACQPEVDESVPPSIHFLIAWVGTFAMFLFFWLTEYPYFRLFYLPALIMLIGVLFKRSRRLKPPPCKTHPLAALVVLMTASNFAFYIYPYSKPEATPPIKLAFDAKAIWGDDVIVFYKEFTSDNWMMRYFNAHTAWKQVDVSNHDQFARQLGEALLAGSDVWVDTTVLGYLASSPAARRRLESYAILSDPWGISSRKHHIRFAQLLPSSSLRTRCGMAGLRDRSRAGIK